jgi:uncharacterized protein involved in outer membrane biogenesis
MVLIRFLVVALGVILCLLLAVLAFLHFADLNPYRERVAAMVSEATGRESRIGGELDLDLWPDVHLSVGDVHLANAHWGSEPEMLQVGQVTLRVRPFSLLSRPVHLKEFVLSDVDLLLETNSDGVSNWAMADAEEGSEEEGEEDEEEKPDASDEDGGLPVLIDRAELHDIRVRQGLPGATEQIFHLADLSLLAQEGDELTIAGDGRVLDQPWEVSGHLGPRRDLAARGAGELVLAVSLGDTELELLAASEERDKAGVRHLTASLKADELDALVQALELPLSDPGPLALDASLSLRQGGGSESQIDGTLGEIALSTTLRREDDTLSFDSRLGTLDRVGALLDVQGLPAEPLQVTGTLVGSGEEPVELRGLELVLGDMQLAASGQAAADFSAGSLTLEADGALLSQVQASLPALPFELAASIDSSPEAIAVSDLRATIGGSDLAGELRLESGTDGALTARLNSRRLDLVELSGEPADGTEGGASGARAEGAPADGGPVASEDGEAAAAANDEKSSGEEKYLFSREPLDLQFLQENRVDLQWQIDQLVTTGLAPAAAELALTLQEGELELDFDFDGREGGVGENRIRLRAEGELARLEVDSRLRDLRLNLLSGDVESASEIPPLDLTLDLSATGHSEHELAAGSEGRLLMTLGPGLMANSVLDRFSGDLLAQLVGALNPLAKTETHTDFQCGMVNIDIEEGLAELEPVFLQSEKLQIAAAGTVDLDSEKLSLEFNTKPRKGVGVSADMFVTPFVALEGTLKQPRIGVNKSSTVLTAGAAVATGGLSVLWKGVMDRVTAEIDHCKKTLPKYSHSPLQEE